MATYRLRKLTNWYRFYCFCREVGESRLQALLQTPLEPFVSRET